MGRLFADALQPKQWASCRLFLLEGGGEPGLPRHSGTIDRSLNFAQGFLPLLKFKALPFGDVVTNLGEWLNEAKMYPVVWSWV